MQGGFFPGINGARGNSESVNMSNPVFTQLVDAHYASRYRFALSLARREADACDLVQQTFYIWATKGEALREETKGIVRFARTEGANNGRERQNNGSGAS